MDLKDIISKEFYGGNRYNFSVRLFGSLASIGIDLDTAINIYRKYMLPHDDEDRTKLIMRTYERHRIGLPVMTLSPDINNTLAKIFNVSHVDRIHKESISSTVDMRLFMRLSDHNRLIIKYLKSRSVDYNKYEVYISISEPDRVCFPCKDFDGRILSMVCRSIFDNKPKYKVYGSTAKCLWNFDWTTRQRIITEGIFDAIKVSECVGDRFNVVALLGSTINRYKRTLLSVSSINILMLDPDISESKLKDMSNYIGNCVYVIPHKDPSDLSCDDIKKLLSPINLL